MKTKNNYVYVYRVDSKPVYVGIGNHLDLENKIYVRAKQISSHLEVAKQKFKEVEISIVVDDLTREGARLIETILIQQFGLNFELLNLNISSNKKEANHLVITKAGVVVKQYDTIENKKLEPAYLELLIKSPLHNKINLNKSELLEYKKWMCKCSKESGYRVKGVYIDEGAKLRKELHRKTTEAKLKAAALHAYLFLWSKNYSKIKTSKTAVYKFKKTGSSKLEAEVIKLANLEVKYAIERPELLKEFAIDYAKKLKLQIN